MSSWRLKECGRNLSVVDDEMSSAVAVIMFAICFAVGGLSAIVGDVKGVLTCAFDLLLRIIPPFA